MSVDCVTLTDAGSGSTARILIGYGFNCFQFQVIRDGRPLELLWSAPGFDSGRERASGSGIPVLFPFAGRIPGTVFRWNDREFPLEAGDGQGNAIHGFVLDRPWRVVACSPESVTGQFQASVDDPRLLERWPADFRITVTYRLDGAALESRIFVENPDQQPLPCGLGMHPYFQLPLGGARSGDCVVKLPVTERWELVGLMPTGKRLPVEDAQACRAGRRFEQLALDDVFTGLVFDGSSCRAEIHDPGSGSTLALEFDEAFRECVVYTPPHREAICIEPYTGVPNAFELQARGLDAGLRVLEPGASFEARVVMRLE